jgi:hypothetical protein
MPATACLQLFRRLSFRDRPAIIDLSPSTQLAQRVTEGVLQTLEDERDATLYYLLARHPGRALVGLLESLLRSFGVCVTLECCSGVVVRVWLSHFEKGNRAC